MIRFKSIYILLYYTTNTHCQCKVNEIKNNKWNTHVVINSKNR